MEETSIQHNNQPCNKKQQQLTNKESKVLVVGKEEGANVPKNGAFNVVLGMTPSGGVLKQTK